MQSPVLFGSIGSDLGQIGSGHRRPFGVDWPHLIAQIISFGIVAFLLHRYAYRPVLAMLEERRKRIEGLANAEKIKRSWPTRRPRRSEVMVQAGQAGRQND